MKVVCGCRAKRACCSAMSCSQVYSDCCDWLRRAWSFSSSQRSLFLSMGWKRPHGSAVWIITGTLYLAQTCQTASKRGSSIFTRPLASCIIIPKFFQTLRPMAPALMSASTWAAARAE
jgi:hypothetical protein